MEYNNEYASKAVGTAGLTTGIIGTALGALSGGTNLFGMGNGAARTCSEDHYVNRYEFDMQMGYEKQLQDQSLKISALESEKISDAKDVEVYKTLRSEMNRMNDNLSTRIGICEANINAQAVYNATNTATIGCIQNQIAQLQSMTKIVIPYTNVSPIPAIANPQPTTTD